VYAGAVKIDAVLRVVGGEPPQPPEVVHRRLPEWTLVPGGCSGVLARRDLVLAVGGFDAALVNLADWDLWSRLARHGPPAWVPLPLVGYRIHGANASLDTAGMVAELDLIDQRYGGPVDRVRFYRHVARVSQRASRRGAAVRYYLQAAARDRHYRRHGLAADLAEIGRGMRGQVRRCSGDAVQERWTDQARPWLERLAAHWWSLTGHGR
jgi:hypothetical protein